MFRFKELRLHGWDFWDSVHVPLDREVVLVTGPNGSGKTTLLDALRQLLNAPRLSTKRRLQNYLRRPDRPALLRAVVANDAADGAAPPFRRERITTPEATLACALVPDGGGTPQKRFAILPGRASLEEIREHLLDGRDWHPPTRYSRALEHAGVTRSLMSVLAIEQGRTNDLFHLKPRELFSRVLDLMGDRSVLVRYQEARRRYEESMREVTRQTGALEGLKVELDRARDKVRRLDLYEDARDKVAGLEAALPASELQALYRRREEAERKAQELRTKVARGESDLDRLGTELEAAGTRAGEAEAAFEAANRAAEQAQEAWAAAREKAARLEERLRDLRAKAEEASALPAEDLDELESRAEGARQALYAAEAGREAAHQALARAEDIVRRLEEGRAVHPHSVEATLEALAERGIEVGLLAERVEVADEERADAAESALGDARFALIVASESESAVIEEAARHAFPGPVWSRDIIEAEETAGPLRLAPGAPSWLPGWIRDVELRPGGRWRDSRGTWVRAGGPRRLGEAGRRARLEEARREREAARRALEAAEHEAAAARERRTELEERVAGERRRRELLAQAAALPEVERDRDDAAAAKDRLAGELQDRSRDREQAHRAHVDAAREHSSAAKALEDRRARLEGERKGLRDLEAELRGVEDRAAELERDIAPELRARAVRGELDGEATVRADLERARARFEELGEPPGPEVREEERNIEANVAEFREHLIERRREAEAAEQELDACRARYLEVIAGSLRDFKRRAGELAGTAEVALELDLPSLPPDAGDRVLEEAEIHARFGFDGKDPLPLGDPSFSGGQQVISGLVLLMATAEMEGRGFFLLDEPFAHLSLDRVDQVGRFLRGTRSQFLLTAPTTLDRAQLDPASLVIVLRKKRSGEPHAPVPLVAEA